MKFLFVAPRFHTNLQYQVRAIKDGGHDVDFLALCSFSNEDFSVVTPTILDYSRLFLIFNKLSGKGETKTSKNHSWKNGFPPFFKLWREMRKIDPDVVMVKNIGTIYSLISTMFARLIGARIIFMLQIDKYRQKPKSWSVAAAGLFLGAKVVTPLLGEQKYQNFNDNLVYIPFPHPVLITEKDFFVEDKINIISIGKFTKRKDQLLLLRALNLLKDKFNLSLTLIGQKDESDYLKSILEFIEKNNLRPLVNLKFDIPWKHTYEEYKKHDLFVLPSYGEPAAFSPVEAMSCGLPVICSDDNGTKCYIKDGENGFVFKNRDLADLTSKMTLMLQDRELIKKMSKNAIGFVEKNCSLESYRDNILALTTDQ